MTALSSVEFLLTLLLWLGSWQLGVEQGANASGKAARQLLFLSSRVSRCVLLLGSLVNLDTLFGGLGFLSRLGLLGDGRSAGRGLKNVIRSAQATFFLES
jgi:hypothetical protein